MFQRRIFPEQESGLNSSKIHVSYSAVPRIKSKAKLHVHYFVVPRIKISSLWHWMLKVLFGLVNRSPFCGQHELKH